MKRNKLVKQGEASGLFFLGHTGASLPITPRYCARLLVFTAHLWIWPPISFVIVIDIKKIVIDIKKLCRSQRQKSQSRTMGRTPSKKKSGSTASLRSGPRDPRQHVHSSGSGSLSASRGNRRGMHGTRNTSRSTSLPPILERNIVYLSSSETCTSSVLRQIIF